MKKTLLIAFLLMLGFTAQAQTSDANDKQYLAGAVPVKDGFVCFEKSYKVPGKSRSELFLLLRDYTQTQIVEGPNHLPQARITEHDSINGVIAANIEEYLYFKRKAWQTHRVRFNYQLVYTVNDGAFTVEMRNLRYEYDPEVSAGGISEVLRAEAWITDSEALNKKGQLTRKAGKFRRFTIDRKNEIFKGAGRATGAIRKVVREIEVEE